MKPQRQHIKMSRALVFAILLFIPLSATAATAATADLLNVSREIRAEILADREIAPENCATRLESIVKRVESFKAANLDRNELKKAAPELIQNFWEARQALRKKMISFAQTGSLNEACVSGVRNAFTALRFMEEYAGVHMLAKQAWLNPKPQRVFSGGFPNMMFTPDYKKMEFKSGDVLVSYGMAYGSAAISHVGDDGGTFSHLAMVYVDPKGTVYTIEAHPEFGVKVAEIGKYLADGKGRSALFRHRDQELAALAGKMIFDVAYPRDRAGDAIPYDFSMDLVDHERALFCTETASYAFEMAAAKLGRANVHLPAFATTISMKSPYILDAFDIRQRLTFAPSDMEVDPNFDMLAEWRDIPRARLMHHQQAALEMQFKWLDTRDYVYYEDLKTLFESKALYAARHSKLFQGLVFDLVPPDLSKKALQAVVNVYTTSDIVLGKMTALDRAQEKRKAGTLMTSRELLDRLEQLRQDDLASYEAYQMERLYPTGGEGDTLPTDQFSWYFRPRE
jgi:hypothetical protein